MADSTLGSDKPGGFKRNSRRPKAPIGCCGVGQCPLHSPRAKQTLHIPRLQAVSPDRVPHVVVEMSPLASSLQNDAHFVEVVKYKYTTSPPLALDHPR